MALRPHAAAERAIVAADPAFAEIVRTAGPCDIGVASRRDPHFAALARSICFQQLAGRAATVIHGRFLDLFDAPPTPEAVLDAGVDRLRTAGLSGSKARTITDLAAHVVDGKVRFASIGRRADDAIVAELSQVWGIGRWTAEMFLMFQLGRLDVWPVGDFGVRKGWGLLHHLSDLPSEKDLEPLGGPLAPWRSIAAWYCWAATDTA